MKKIISVIFISILINGCGEQKETISSEIEITPEVFQVSGKRNVFSFFQKEILPKIDTKEVSWDNIENIELLKFEDDFFISLTYQNEERLSTLYSKISLHERTDIQAKTTNDNIYLDEEFGIYLGETHTCTGVNCASCELKKSRNTNDTLSADYHYYCNCKRVGSTFDGASYCNHTVIKN